MIDSIAKSVTTNGDVDNGAGCVLRHGMAVQPGIYKNVPYDVYATWPAVRASTLNACARSMAHGRESELNPKPDTAATCFGSSFHSIILEPHNFFELYVPVPKVDRRTKVGKNVWAEFESKIRPDQQLITEPSVNAARAMIAGVMACRDAAELISAARAKELSIVWRDDDTGLLCKARIDALSILYDRTYVVDLKSTADASRLAFRRQNEKLGYYRSLAWYRWGLSVLHPAPRRAALLAVEKTPPYAAAVYELTENALDAGLDEMLDLLRRYDKSLKSGIWPGYGDDIKDMDLSPWLQKDLGFV